MKNDVLTLVDDRIPRAVETADVLSLAEALQLVAGRDRDAFEEVYRRTASKLFGVCLEILPSRAEAEDALQDVYFAVWLSAALFDRQRGTAMTWLITIARNRCVDQLRRSRSSMLAPVELAENAVDPQPLACEAISASEEHRKMQRCLELLNEQDANALKSAFFGGSTYGELAMAAGISFGTMKSRMRRVLLQLRDEMS